VDEYPEDHTFRLSPRSSTRPLTLGAIVELILTIRLEEKDFPEGFLGTCLRFNTDEGANPDEAPGFITGESLIYPHLDRLVGMDSTRARSRCWSPSLESRDGRRFPSLSWNPPCRWRNT